MWTGFTYDMVIFSLHRITLTFSEGKATPETSKFTNRRGNNMWSFHLDSLLRPIKDFLLGLCGFSFRIVIQLPSRHLLVQSSNGNSREKCEICSDLTIKTPEWRQ